MDLSGAIETLLIWINDAVARVGEDPLLTATLAQGIPGAYELVMTIFNIVIRPIGWTILSVVFLIEMYQIMTRDSFTQGAKVIEYVMFVLIKMMALKLVIDAAPELLELLYNTSMQIAHGISTTATSSNIGLSIDGTAVADAIGGDFGTELVAVLLLFIVFIITTIASYVAKVVLLGRFIQLYILLAFSPIPLATLPSGELRNRGINFVMHFFALSLQAAVILLIMYLFPAVVGDGLINYDWQDDWVGGLVLFSLYSIVLCISVLSSNRIAKAILGNV